MEPLEDLYFNWLRAKVTDPRSSNYTDLLRIMHGTPFSYIESGDRHREADGRELRVYFLNESDIDIMSVDSLWLEEPCSVLEMLIAFSDRAKFQTRRPLKWWFWRFLTNLNLNEYRQLSQDEVPLIEEILYTLVFRTYRADGHGGLMPLRTPKRDQRKVELWHQLFEYIDEQGL